MQLRRFARALLALSFLVLFAYPFHERALVFVFWFPAMFVGLMANVLQNDALRRTTYVLFVASLPAMFSPIDVCYRSGERFLVREVPAGYSYDWALENHRRGQVLNRDFVHYRGHAHVLHGAKRAILIVLPFGEDEESRRFRKLPSNLLESSRGRD